MANYAGVTEGFLGGLNAGLNTLSTIGQLKAQARQQQNQELLLQQEQEKQQRLQNLANSFAPVFSGGDNALIQLDQSRKDEQAGKSILQDFAKLVSLPQDIRGPQVDSFAQDWEQANGQPMAENVIGFLKKVKPEDGQAFINRIQAVMPGATALSGTLSNPGQFRSSLAEIHAMPDPSPDAVQQNSQIAEYRRLQGEMKVLDGQINRGIMVLQKNPYPEAVQVVEPMLKVWQQRREQVSAQMKEFSTPFTLSPGSGRYTGFGDPIAQQPTDRSSQAPVEVYSPTSPTGTEFVTREQAIGRPGKAPSGTAFEFDENGRVKSIQMGRGAGQGGGMTTATAGSVQKEVIGAEAQLSEFKQIRSKLQGKFLQAGPRFEQAMNALQEKTGAQLSPDAQKELKDYSNFVATTQNSIATIIHDRYGANLTKGEEKRAMASLPNPGTGIFDADSISQFSGKLDSIEQLLEASSARKKILLQEGLSPNKEEDQAAIEARFPLESAQFQTINGVKYVRFGDKVYKAQ